MATQGTCSCCSSRTGVGSGQDGQLTCYCPVEGVIDTVGKKYSMRIVALLGVNGPMRFGELQEALGATSTSTLAERLDELVDDALIERRSFDEVPPRVEYSLTHRGRELEERLQPLLEWAADEE